MSALSNNYPILVRVFDSAQQAGRAVADQLCSMISRHQDSGGSTVLGPAAGATSTYVYDALTTVHAAEGFSFSSCHAFNLDEYYPMAASDEKSFYQQIERVLETLGVPRENRYAFSGTIPEEDVAAHCGQYEHRISKCNGIDFQLLGIGRNGHIGFNEPGSLPTQRTRIVSLTDETRRDAASRFGGMDRVPTRGLTLGIGTILDAGEICLMAAGAHKAEIVKRLIRENPNPTLPASYLKNHPAVTVFLDTDAARLLELESNWAVIS